MQVKTAPWSGWIGPFRWVGPALPRHGSRQGKPYPTGERPIRPRFAPVRGLVPLLAVVLALGADGSSKEGAKSAKPGPAPVGNSSPTASIDREAETMAFVREHHPELGVVLGSLKARNQAEYRKAIGELSQLARNLADLKTRNPKRYELALDAWKARSRVELLAAQLAGSPTEELRSQLRTAIESKVDAEIRRQQFDLAQAEEAARKLRQSLDRLENHRDEVVEARYRALQPKKARGGKGVKEPDLARPVTVPSSAGKPENRP